MSVVSSSVSVDLSKSETVHQAQKAAADFDIHAVNSGICTVMRNGERCGRRLELIGTKEVEVKTKGKFYGETSSKQFSYVYANCEYCDKLADLQIQERLHQLAIQKQENAKKAPPTPTVAEMIPFTILSLLGHGTPPSVAEPARPITRVVLTDGCVYEGEVVDGFRHGRGTVTWTDGATYEGQWLKNLKEGHGIYTDKHGNVYDGQFKDDRMHGKGVYTYADGRVFVGMWKDGSYCR